MASLGHDPISSATLARAEMHDLRRHTLDLFLNASLWALWCWYALVLGMGRLFVPNTLLLLVLGACVIAAKRLGRDHYGMAATCAIAMLILLHGGIMTLLPNQTGLAVGVLVVAAAAFVAGARIAVLAAVGTWALALGIRNLVATPSVIGATEIMTLMLYLLMCLVVWLGSRSLAIVLDWALTGWLRAAAAIEEIQDRRGELYRVVRSLEESTYRIERMNNELLIAQREAEEARAIKTRLATTISHELRGPLNVILGFSKLMVLSPESYPEPLPRAYRTDIDTIYRNTQHLVSLVNDVLDLSQIEAQRLPLVKDLIDMEAEVVSRVISIVEPLAKRKGLVVEQHLSGQVPPILADPVRMRQALLNLLLNAVRFTETGSISVHTQNKDGRFLLSIRDTGPGIAEEAIPRLFREFSQVQTTDTREAQGSGLGLAIAKHLIELHHGEISVESKVGSGTEFMISLPLCAGLPAAADIVATADRRQARRRDACLVVHDNLDLARILARQMANIAIMGLPDDHDLAMTAQELKLNAIITSPGRRLSVRRQLDALGLDIPMILCDLPSLANQSNMASVKSYLVKPIASEVLYAAIEKLICVPDSTVLIVDDDQDAVRLLQRMLQAMPWPCRVLKAYDGAQALQIMQHETPSVLLLDWVMHGMDGPSTLERMRSDERLGGIPVVIISGQDWLHEGVTLGDTITMQWGQPIALARGARHLASMLDNLASYANRSASV